MFMKQPKLLHERGVIVSNFTHTRNPAVFNIFVNVEFKWAFGLLCCDVPCTSGPVSSFMSCWCVMQLSEQQQQFTLTALTITAARRRSLKVREYSFS